ncbi:MAG: hypothetical protein KME32_23315 [Mojavia pulchra JT2-VF2]|uniref:Uncharacterized protein n=1 Tax=Mojavia pulchra JT2-VF2 TaxID=287848 RepID=A0A951Q1G1_9NOST|nr:hypothetical protein [Mojavia pulchra JT2-VF2]
MQLNSPPQTFLSPLLELREYYARLVEKYENLHRQARANLNHVEALLSNWSSNSNANSNLSTDEVIGERLTVADEENLSFKEVDLVESIDSELPEINDLEIDNSFSASQDSDEPPASTTSSTTSGVIEPPSETPENLLQWPEIPMLNEYQTLNRTEAIKKLLQKHIGTVCHIDFIVRSLYGELKPDILKVVKGRVQSSLTHGKQSNKWSIVPGKPGCYTLNLSLLNATRTHDSFGQGKHKNQNYSAVSKTEIIPMVKAFEGKLLIDAITSLLQQNPGKVFSIAEVINGLYGELDPQQFKQIKDKVLKELSRGYRTGRFSKVPEKIGLYTWDFALVTKA